MIEVWGKQADSKQDNDKRKGNGPKHRMSTRQLMNAETVSKVNSVNSSTRDDDNRYKLLSELNSLRKRNARLNSRMVSLLLPKLHRADRCVSISVARR